MSLTLTMDISDWSSLVSAKASRGCFGISALAGVGREDIEAGG